jgi:lipopolysaccharide cholinephosphotransferase
MIQQKVEKYIVDDSNYQNFCFPNDYILGIYEIVKYTKELCDRERIEYFIDGGTLLGCVRDGGQILYDNDADFGITPTNFKKLLLFKEEFQKKNYNFIVTDNYKIQIQNLNIHIKIDEVKNIKLSPCIDILVYKPIKHNNITEFVIQNDRFRIEYPFASHYKTHLYPLKDYTYRCLDAEPLILKGANNPKRYLNGTYPNWETKKIYDHKTYVITE